MKKRVLSLFLTLVMLLSLVPMTALATATDLPEATATEMPEASPAEETPAEDEAVAAILARIEALPDPADFPTMTKGELQAALDETWAIFDLYDALEEEEQKEQIDLTALFAMYEAEDYLGSAPVANPTAAHTHMDASGYPIDFQPWESTTELPAYEGSWYLTDNVTLNDNWTIRDNVNLCLNGKVINLIGCRIEVEGTFTLYDCDNTEHTVSDCTFKGGYITGGNSSGVYVFGGSFVMNGGTICGNTVDAFGGGVYVGSGSFTMNGGTICGNTAENGGGVYVNGDSFVMNGGTICGNTANMGGGVYVNEGSFTMNGGTITGNTAANGGGIFNGTNLLLGGTAVVSGNLKGTAANDVENVGTIIINTEYKPTSGMSVGLYGANIVVTGASEGDVQYFFADDATKYVKYESEGNKIVLANLPPHTHGSGESEITFQPWTATDSLPTEGNWYLTKDVTLSANWEITQNVSLCLNDKVINLNGKNIAVADDGKFELYDCGKTVRYWNKDANGLWKLAADQKTATAYTTTGGCIIGGNVEFGGGVGVAQGGSFVMNGGTICGNNAQCNGAGTGIGGGVYVSGSFVMNDGAICGNTADGDGGGGVGVAQGGSFVMNGGSICNNTAIDDGWGGGVYAEGSFVMNGGTIRSNFAGEGGVLVYCYGTIKLLGGEISGNTAAWECGGVGTYGGVAIVLGGKVVIKDNTANGQPSDLCAEASIDATTKPQEGMEVGLGNTDIVVTNASEGDKQYFFANDPAYKVVYKDSKIQLEARTNPYWYIDEKGEEQEVPTGETSKLTAVSSSSAVTWDKTWVLVTGNVKIENAVTLSDNVNLILADGAELEITGNIAGSNKTLTVYAQTNGTGKLTVTNIGTSVKGIVVKKLVLTGGNIEVNSTESAIKAEGVTVLGGTLTADSIGFTGIIAGYSDGLIVSGGTVNGSGKVCGLQDAVAVSGTGVVNLYGGTLVYNANDKYVKATVQVSNDGIEYADWGGYNSADEWTLSKYKYLKLTAAHEHAFTYSASGATLTATCTEGCTAGYDTTPLSITLTGDVAANAAAVKAWNDAGAAAAELKYYAKDDTEFKTPLDAPVKSGKYVVKATASDKTASLEFDYVSPYWYIDEKGEKVELETVPPMAESKTGDVTWSGWVFVPAGEKLTITGNVTMSDNVNLILADGAELEITGNIAGSNKTLTVYAQTNGTGKLTVTNIGTSVKGIEVKKLVLTGGNIEVNSTQSAINAEGITVLGGTLTANSIGFTGIIAGYSDGLFVSGGTVNGSGNLYGLQDQVTVSGTGVVNLHGGTGAHNGNDKYVNAAVEVSNDGVTYTDWDGYNAESPYTLSTYKYLKLTAVLPCFDPCNGEAVIESKTVPTGYTKDSTKWGDYVFAGWYDAKTGGTELTGTPAGGTTYYAHWWTDSTKKTLVLTEGIEIKADGVYIGDSTTKVADAELAKYGLSFAAAVADPATPATLTMTNAVIEVGDGVCNGSWCADDLYWSSGKTNKSPVYFGLCSMIDLNMVLNGNNTIRITKKGDTNATPIAVYAANGNIEVNITVTGSGTLTADASDAEGRNVFGLGLYGTLTNSATITGKSGKATYMANGIFFWDLENTAGTLTGIGGTGAYTSGLNNGNDGLTAITGGKAVGYGGTGTVEYYGLWTGGEISVSDTGILELHGGTKEGVKQAAMYLENAAKTITISDSGKIVADSAVKNDGKYGRDYTVTGGNKTTTGTDAGLTLTKSGTADIVITANSGYAFTVTAPDTLKVNEECSTASVKLEANRVLDIGYDKVLIKVEMTAKPDGSNPKILATDSQSVEWNIAEVGQWGPSEGFAVSKDYSATTNLKLKFDKMGTYTATFKLIDLNNGNAVLCESSKTIEVSKTEVTISATKDDFTYGETGKIGYKEVSVTDRLVEVNDLIATYYKDNGESANPRWTKLETVPTDAGNYKVTLSVPETNDVYTGSKELTFTIAKRTVTLVADSITKTYDGNPLTCTTFTVKEDKTTAGYGFVGEEGIDHVTMTPESIITDVGSVSNVIASIYPKGGTNRDNYDITLVNGTLTVLKAAQDAPKKGEKYTLSGNVLTAESGYEILISGTNAPTEGNPTTAEVTIADGQTYSIRLKGDENHFASPYTAIDTTVTVNVLAVPSSMGTVSGSGKYAIGSNVTLTATPRSGYEFVEWQNLDGKRVSTNPSYTIKEVMTGQTLIAAFKPKDKVVATLPTIEEAKDLVYTSSELTGISGGAGWELVEGTLTGTNAGVYSAKIKLKSGYDVWSDGTTADKTLVWNIFKAPQNAPENVSATEDSITGVNNTMEYMKMGGSSYTGVTDTTISGTTISVSDAGTYYVRYKETPNYYASPATVVVVSEPTLNVVTLQPSDLKSDSATLNGVFAPYKAGCTAKFLLNGENEPVESVDANGIFSLSVDELKPDTDYTVTAVVTAVVNDVVNDTQGNTVTFHTPKAVTPTADDGKIKVNATAESSAKIIVSVERGNDVIASWTSGHADTSHTANFANLPYGNYNVVVRTNNGHYTETKMLSVVDENEVTVDFTIPKGKLAAVVDVKPNTPKAAVDGLGEILSTADKNAAATGSKDVEVKLEVEKKAEAQATGATEIKKLLTGSTGGNITVDFLDMSLLKTTTELDAGGNATSIDTKDIGATNNTVIEIAVPYSNTGKAPKVLRYHNGMAEELTKLDARPTAPYMDGTYFIGDGYVFIYASGFSTYAIGYEQQSGGSSTGGGGGSGTSSYAVESESAKNGTFSTDKKSASAGSTVTITVAPDKGFTLETLTVLDKNGKEVEVKNLGNNKYSFKMPSSKVTVSATFMEDNSMLNFFVDVKATDYFYDAVLWAAENDITKGTDAVHFSPDMGTTRAQVVTFLWRTAGCPEPEGDASKFVDVPANEYYAKAVAWAIEQVITKGTSETTFSPDSVCTRGQIVTFLARFAGVADEAAGYKHGFTDVKAADYFNNAVAWAKDNKVTEGTSATTFSPNTDCTRAQVVTFLYRWMVK